MTIASFGELIKKIKENDNNHSITKLKKDESIKMLSRCVVGGVSGMNKNEFNSLLASIYEYKSNEFIINGKTFVPDEEQMKIITSENNHHTIIMAGAGTGKTFTIVLRIKYLLDNHILPNKILVLTFNKESQANLEKRIKMVMGFNLKMDVKTIDSFCWCLMAENGLMDNKIISLAELSTFGRDLMREFGKEVSSRYEYIFFDEFQDVNNNQFDIMKIFAQNGCLLTVIGDDSQNIYQFRGTDNYYIVNFDKLIPGTKTFMLTTNYRSTQQIVNIGNFISNLNEDGVHKTMKPSKDIEGIVDLRICEGYMFENVICKKINKYLEDGYLHEDIAILSRNSESLKKIETELEKRKIPHVSLLHDKYSPEYKQRIIGNSIVLSTIHSAKGLEWENVFIVGLADEYFPQHLNNGIKNINEERRLFYVASTRAKRNLHFIVKNNEFPLCRFLEEAKEHIDIKIDEKYSSLGVFNTDDKNREKNIYSVIEMIGMLNSQNYEEMSKKGLIYDFNIRENKIFDIEEPIKYSDAIKERAFEADYGIYCDRYVSRELMISNGNTINDQATKQILEDTQFSSDDFHLHKKYDLNQLMRNRVKPDIEDREKVKNFLARMKKNKDTFFNPSEFQYPDSFKTQLIESYKNFTDSSIDSKNCSNDIYTISLCSRFCHERRRLLYRNIKNLFDEMDKHVIPNARKYLETLKNNKIKCKGNEDILFEFNKNLRVYLVGEYDFIDCEENKLIDLKCSESEIKKEWIVQLLSYYSMIKKNNKIDIPIKKLSIVNLFNGMEYEFDISEDYDYDGLIEFYKKMIKNDLKGVRSQRKDRFIKLDEILSDDVLDDKNDDSQDVYPPINLDNSIKRKGTMVLDVENNIKNNDIIQIAYKIYDQNNNLVKSFNKYVKDRYVDPQAMRITKITTKILKEKGEDFWEIMNEFLIDLNSVVFFVGHFVQTDISKIKNNMEKFGIVVNCDPFDRVKIKYTEKIFKQMFPSIDSLKLESMYYKLFGKKMTGMHDASEDVEYTARCYFKMCEPDDSVNLLEIPSMDRILASSKINEPKKITNKKMKIKN
jgi:DNA polymerase III epsilon subunit-like protein